MPVQDNDLPVYDASDGKWHRSQTIPGGAVIHSTTRIVVGASPYTALAADDVIFCDTDGGAITVLLPAGVAGRWYKLVNCGGSGNHLTITPNGAELLNGANASATIVDGDNLEITYEATEGWF